jgi:hypothetical protein
MAPRFSMQSAQLLTPNELSNRSPDQRYVALIRRACAMLSADCAQRHPPIEGAAAAEDQKAFASEGIGFGLGRRIPGIPHV